MAAQRKVEADLSSVSQSHTEDGGGVRKRSDRHSVDGRFSCAMFDALDKQGLGCTAALPRTATVPNLALMQVGTPAACRLSGNKLLIVELVALGLPREGKGGARNPVNSKFKLPCAPSCEDRGIEGMEVGLYTCDKRHVSRDAISTGGCD